MLWHFIRIGEIEFLFDLPKFKLINSVRSIAKFLSCEL